MKAICMFLLCGFAALPLLAYAQAPVPQAVLTGMTSAENSIQTSDGKIFVSAENGLFQVQYDAARGWSKRRVPVRFNEKDAQHGCYFLGMAQYQRTLYALCARNVFNVYFTRKYLMAMDLDAATPVLQEAGRLSTTGIPNGLAADQAGNLYYASSGILYPGKIHQLRLDGRFHLRSDKRVEQFFIGNPNGLKRDGDNLYVSASPVLGIGKSRLLRYRLDKGHLQREAVLTSRWGFFDDLFLLDDGGLLQADYLRGRILRVQEPEGDTSLLLTLSKPTSILLLRLPGQSALLITQRGKDRAVIYANDWQLKARSGAAAD